ncbi:MAG TPA: PH domain-containing protein [Flexivirga sp.]|uniref:PH domain-containing protein n=1 Tax=Flexivirga sp. TaxID=1962927 RepID=UPI002C50252F|nr:PH domain-containing protein [Flexivirga sp.]HWC24274.1 PH domain-containing protein [Flexivirga sp.]
MSEERAEISPGESGAREQPTDSGVWRRLSPRMLLIHPVKELIRFLPALVAVVVAGSTGGQNWWGLLAAAGAIGLGVLRWFSTRYRFTADQVQLRHGVLNTTTVSAPMDRVRSVDVTASVMHRALGLAEVQIGTGAGEKALKLEGLTSSEAAALRGELLHRGAEGAPEPVGASPGSHGDVGGASHPTAAYQPETVVYQLNPAWIRYAPFGPAGLVAALAIVGVGSQFLNESGIGWGEDGLVAGTVDRLAAIGVIAAVLAVLVGALVVIVVLALLGYLLAFHGFRLTRDGRGGTYHVSRGLLTTRATSLEIRRLRGVEVHRPVPLRWAGGAHLSAITTGVKEDGRGMSTTLTPPSPADVVTGTADAVLGGKVVGIPLRSHGAAATRRRYTRALAGAVVLVALLIAAAVVWNLPALGVCAVLPIAGGVLLGRSRAHWLGHAVTDRFLITRSGSIGLSTNVIERRGAVGVTVRRSFFQRRAGVATVSLATAAGNKDYPVLDLPQDQVGKLAAQIVPGHVEQFLR